MTGAKILVVEDEWLVAQGISENLKDLGYEVAGLAPSGEEALRLAAESPPDLVVMDILLQGEMDGIDAAELLRQRFDLPVVFLTAYADPHTLERAKVAEPYGYILKPFEVRELHSAVEISLYKSRIEKRLQHLAGILRAIRNVNQLIVQEKNRERLMQKACRLLTEGRGYFTAWIALVGQKGQITAFAVDGEESDTANLRQLLDRGEIPGCGRRALKEKDLLMIEDLSPQAGCFLWENYQDRGALVTPLSHQSRVYGVLGVLLPVALARDEEELSLFKELAADLSLALYNLDLEDRELQAQEALSASEEKFRLLVENANQIILVVQGDGIRFANPAAVANSGYSLAELTSRPFLEFVHPDDREAVIQNLTARLQGREVPDIFLCRYFTKDGALRWAEIRTSDITWEGEPATLNCLSDITERKEMVEALRQSEEKFRTFFEKAPIGYQSLDEQGCIQEINPTWQEILGYPREEVLGRWVGDFFTPEYQEFFPAKFAHFKELGEFRDVMVDMVKKDGSVITVSINCRIVFDDAGRFLRSHCVFTDITSRRRAEMALKESEERYRTVADFTYDMEYWLGPDQELIYMSPSCEHLTGYSREEFFQAPDLLAKIVHPQDREQFAQHGQEARTCPQPLDIDFRVLHRDGREVWVSHACQPVYGLDGQYLGRRVNNRDITERRKAEQEVKKEKEKAQHYLDIAGVIMVVIGPDQKTMMVNKKACEVLGYAEQDIIGKNWFDICIPEKARDYVKYLFAELMADNVDPHEYVENFIITKRGEERLIAWHNTVLRDEDGRIIGTLSSGEDITERQRAVEALRESEERFRLLVENAPDAIIIQTEKRYAYLNKEALKLFGAATEDQLLGRPVLERFPPDLHDLIQERIRLVNIERQALPPRELQLLQMDGTPKEVEACTVPFRYQEKNGALVFFRDITARKQAEKAVQEGIRLNQLLLDSLPCVAMLLRPFTREIVAANEAARQMAAVPGAFCYATFGQRQDPCPFCQAPQVWKTGQSQSLEAEALDKVWDAHWVPITADLYLHYAFDITARKETERTQKMLETQLVQAQKMEALGTLAGGIAHDFNNILGAMLGFAELAHIGLPENSEEAGYLENLLKAGDRARSLVKQILSFSRREKATRQPLSLTPIIKETIKFLRASLPTTIEIKTQLQGGKALVAADPTQIHQILLNLATNAAHAMEEKGGILAVGLRVVHLTPDETSLNEGITPGPYLELRVSDTGPGLDPEIQERIFEPFFTTKGPWKGTGMGLAVVYGIVKSMDGSIKVTSQPGQGATFLVLLPMVEVGLAQGEPEILAPLSKGVGRILFVDDDEDFFQAGQRMLKELGYEIAAFDNSQEALKKFQAQPRQFDLLICDQTMPGLTGLELAAACSQVRPDLPIILLTGFSESVTPEKVRAAGIREVVTKPFDLRQIGESIKKILKKNITIVE
jgi:PAS domain S-box-containing protein